MTRAALRFWGWVWACLFVVSFAATARAEENCFEPIPVCVRPPDVPKHFKSWFYYGGDLTEVIHSEQEFKEKSCGHLSFTYDPEAPPENTKLLPSRWAKLPCDPKPPPPPKPEKPKPKKEAPKQEGSGASRASGYDQKDAKKARAESPPQAPPAPSARAEEEEERGPRPPEHGVLPNQGVTKDWPHAVLPKREAEPKRSVLQTKRRDDRCAWVLPWQGQKAVDRAQVCRGKGEGNKPGIEKTAADKLAEHMAYAAGLLNLQLDEDLKRPDGKQYGVMGGRNPDGPNNPLAQAAASAVGIAAVVLSPKADKLFKRLMSPGTKATPLLMKEMESVGHDVAEEIATKLGPKLGKRNGEMLMRVSLADALREKGAIGPYEVMKQFTDKLEGQWQAHHILERKFAVRFKLGDAAKVPSVILTEAEHKEMTAKLDAATRKVRDARELWQAYQDVYRKHPHWLDAIKPYFVKGK